MSLSGTDLPTSILFCRLCQSLYRHPRTLPCLHSFCADCLRQVAPTHDATGEAVSLNCPVCNQGAPLPASGVTGFTANDFLARMCQEYVGEVQRTLVTCGSPRAGQQGPATPYSGRASSTSSSSPPAFSATTLTGTGTYFQKPAQQQQQHTQGFHGYQAVSVPQGSGGTLAGYRGTVSPTPSTSAVSQGGSKFDYAFRTSRKTAQQPSPTPSATEPPPATVPSSSYLSQPTAAGSAISHALSPPRHSSSSSSTSEVVLQTARRLSSEGTPSRGVGVGRRLSSTPKDVVRTWECLQRKLNGLHAASLQATYSLETVNMHETNWHQRKQDMCRDIQRRSAQLQFFVKRQERLLLAALDSRGTDESFTSVADRARGDVRQNLKALMHEIDTLRSVLDLATDSELLALSALLLGSSVPQTQVSMETPELRFVVPEEISLEDMVSRDFGCLTSTLVSNVIFTPENIERVFLEEDQEEEEEEDEAFVTDTYTMDTSHTYVPSAATAASSKSDYMATTTATTTTTQDTAAITTSDQDNLDNVAFIDDDEADDEEDDDEVVVEETFEIIDGKMQVVSKKSYPSRKPVSPPASSSQQATSTSSQQATPTSRPADEVKGSGRSSMRLATTTTTTVSGHDTGGGRSSKDVSPRGRTTETRRTVNSSPTTANVPSTLTATTTTRELVRAQQDTGTSGATLADTGESQEPASPPTEQQQQSPRTLENFQQVREKLRQKRRELLVNASVFALPRHPEVAYLVSNREKRVQSLDRRSSGPSTSRRSQSPASPRERVHVPTVAAPFIHTPRHSSDSEDSLHSDPGLVSTYQRRASAGPATATTAGAVFRHERRASGGGGGASFGAARIQTSCDAGASAVSGATVMTSSSSSVTTSAASPSPAAQTVVCASAINLPADKPAASRPVRRAISAASDRASKMEYLRETWRRRKELLIQNEAFTTASTPTHAEPEDDIQVEGGDNEVSAQSEQQESDRETASTGDEKSPTPVTGQQADVKSSSKIKQSIRSRITNLKHALKKNGSKGSEEGKQLESVRSPEKKRGTEVSATSGRPVSPGSLTETPAEQKVLKTVDSILQKRNVPIPDPKSSTLSPAKSQQISGPQDTSTAPLPNQTSPVGGSKPSMMVRPSPRDPPSPTAPSSSSAASALETLAEDEGVGGGEKTATTTSPSRRSALRPTSPVNSETSKEKIQQAKAIMRRKKERWRSLSLT